MNKEQCHECLEMHDADSLQCCDACENWFCAECAGEINGHIACDKHRENFWNEHDWDDYKSDLHYGESTS